MKKPFGRPTSYKPSVIKKALKYIDSCETTYELDERGKVVVNVVLPTIEGLAIRLHVSRSTLYEWKKKHADFSDIIERLLNTQFVELLQQALAGNYNATIAKVLLIKHFNREKKMLTKRGFSSEEISRMGG